MSARICPSCQYTVVSTVVATCPNCGKALPATLGSSSSSSMMLVAVVLILAGGAGAWYLMRGPEAVVPPTSPSTTSAAARPTAPPGVPVRPASPRAAVASPVVPAPSAPATAGAPIDDRKVATLVAQLNAPGTAWQAASALAEIPSPRAEQALMAAYDKREYGKMAGAAAFYARKRPAGYEKVLVALLEQSRDLAVAQDLILARDPRISEPARKWAAEQGFKLVPSKKTPTGVTWVQE
jgi:hypothetical protein